MRYIRFLLLLLAPISLFSQQTFPLPAPSDTRDGLYAFTNATIYTDYKTRIENATLLIRKDKIEACGAGIAVPKEAVVVDCSGKTIYPGFIDAYVANYGLAEARMPERMGGPGGGGARASSPTLSTKKGAFSWNEALRSEYNAASVFALDAKAAEEWRKLGFGALMTHNADGISRGTGAVVAPTDVREHQAILSDKAAHVLSFRKGSSPQDYPASLMGCITLLRQTYLDGQWYKEEGYKTEKNLSIEAWNAALGLPQIFEVSDKLDALRAARIAKEFGATYILKSAGDDYQRLADIAALKWPLILPLNFPEGYDVRDPYDAQNIALKDLKHWEMAPANPARVHAANIPFALTANGLRDKSKFWENLRKAIELGLPEEAALRALTAQPAELLRMQNKLGSLEKDKIANFLIVSGNIFKPEARIVQNWVLGKGFDVTPDKFAGKDLSGDYKLMVGDKNYTLSIKGKPEQPDANIMRPDSTKGKAMISQSAGLVQLSFQQDTVTKQTIILSGDFNTWSGQAQLPNGTWTTWRAERQPAGANNRPGGQRATAPAKPDLSMGSVLYPFTAFGTKAIPQPTTFLIKNATVWTSEKDGALANTDVLLSGGKIQRIGANITAPTGATVVDGTGKYLTAGIIDEHSHIAATRGINEGTQESTAEVRIGDIIDSEDVDIYRQLAGGVTSSHILHGSANPIGGQTQLIKLRWGYAPEALKFEGWPGQIKFALGENVKRSNWGDGSRYPQTRMGVEQVYVDYFTRAKEYGLLKQSGKPYRRDLELEALLEILQSQRFITCHSYVQSEITMLLRVAERFNFKINTFTHILEGYKVADKMAKHGAGASSFSDWWAYKYEVLDAIPQSPKMMADQGVTVAINSDDAEMARRLNQEAAKSVMYAGMNEADAWNMVTINPAKLLRVDNRTGSIKVGKDADVVLWTTNPLSVYAKAEMTWVDGIKFFDRAADAIERDNVRLERARILQKLINAKKGGEGGERPTAPKGHYHCDSDEDEGH
jgi:imidazolonepropionase-like amidohydrolase